MSSVLVDSTVLIDLLTKDVRWSFWSRNAIEQAANTSRVIINIVI